MKHLKIINYYCSVVKQENIEKEKTRILQE